MIPAGPVSPPATPAAIPAVAYVRMSTEHQQYSTQNQLDRIREYAGRRGMEIREVFADEGKSGLHLRGRDSLRQMITTVESGQATFRAILVYDISRWGRFQDTDESGFYEYICKRAGIAVHYCAEQFENDGSPASNIIKSVKRSMAGEYSRELSSKVFQGACRLVQLGYKQGGAAGYGLRRLLVDPRGKAKGVLGHGEQKSIQTDRIVLVPGPPEEQEVVRGMFAAFLAGDGEERISRELNRRGVKTDWGRRWTRQTVHQILTNEKYIGNNVYHRTSFKLKRKYVQNPPPMWIRADGAFPAIVDAATFAAVQDRIARRKIPPSDEQMLAALRRVWRDRGRLSAKIINQAPGVPSYDCYVRRFGSLQQTYRLIGYESPHDLSFVGINRTMRARFPRIVADVSERLKTLCRSVEHHPTVNRLLIDGELTVSILLSRCFWTRYHTPRWLVRFEPALRSDFTIVVRMDESNHAVRDYYLFPAFETAQPRLTLRDDNGALLDSYRFDNLNFFYEIAERTTVEGVA